MRDGLQTTLNALADPTRFRIVEALRAGPLPVTALASELGTSLPSMSRHLRVLRCRGLVHEERVDHDARLRVYRLRHQPFGEVVEWLEHLEAIETETGLRRQRVRREM